jgi:glyoxylase-like metal-dependent hydrolase (beta-lactamase superfamily II)
VVNTHSDGDHWFGNQLAGATQIIATKNAAEDMRINLTPDDVRGIVANTDELGIAGQFFARLCAPFDFSGIELVLPTETFTGRKTVQVGEKTVELIDLGPAHTRGDLVVFVPEDRVVFVGDLLFRLELVRLWRSRRLRWHSCDHSH